MTPIAHLMLDAVVRHGRFVRRRHCENRFVKPCFGLNRTPAARSELRLKRRSAVSERLSRPTRALQAPTDPPPTHRAELGITGT
jgi:hypothetical protein